MAAWVVRTLIAGVVAGGAGVFLHVLVFLPALSLALGDQSIARPLSFVLAISVAVAGTIILARHLERRPRK